MCKRRAAGGCSPGLKPWPASMSCTAGQRSKMAVRVPVWPLAHWYNMRLKVVLPGLLCIFLVSLPLVGLHKGAGGKGKGLARPCVAA